MTSTLKDSYAFYKANNDTKVTCKQYENICVTLNVAVSNFILEGGTFEMGSHLSTIYIARYERTFRLNENGTPKLPVNWLETRKLAAQGIKKFVYFTDKYFCGWRWSRGFCTVPGKGAYKFKASRTNGVTSKDGNINKLVTLLKSDELAYLRFKLIT